MMRRSLCFCRYHVEQNFMADSKAAAGLAYALANKGIDTRTLQAYLGHRSINSTTRYAALAPGRFKNIWGRV